MHETTRTGVRFVFCNSADRARAQDASDWYDIYSANITGPIGPLANAYRFGDWQAAGTPAEPMFAAIYDIITEDPSVAWPQTEASPLYPKPLFTDERAPLVVPILRGSWTLKAERTNPSHGALTGVHLVLSDGPENDGWPERAAGVLATGVIHAASHFELIEGFPEPPRWLDIYETAAPDPHAAGAQIVATLKPAQGTRLAGSFTIISSFGVIPLAPGLAAR
jgi:hypothetical protein